MIETVFSLEKPKIKKQKMLKTKTLKTKMQKLKKMICTLTSIKNDKYLYPKNRIYDRRILYSKCVSVGKNRKN
jgi:hypothetical protein